jgi:hypothetical protein
MTIGVDGRWLKIRRNGYGITGDGSKNTNGPYVLLVNVQRPVVSVYSTKCTSIEHCAKPSHSRCYVAWLNFDSRGISGLTRLPDIYSRYEGLEFQTRQ